MDLGLRARKAVLAASSSGLGLACASALAREGCTVFINGRDAQRLALARQQIEQHCDAMVHSVCADINTERGRSALVQACPDADILVTNNAGPPPGVLADWDHATWSVALEANLLAPILLIRALLPGMRERRFGRIVNITSAMVKSPRAHQGLSTSARAALTAVCKAISAETVVDNVTINNLLPERIDTPRQQFLTERQAKLDGTSYDEARRMLADTVAAKRFGTTEEFASMCAFLCSTQAAFICGQNIQIDGGSYKGLV